jgi:hypothetical protein
MEKQDVLNKLSSCCKTVTLGALPSLGDASIMVTNKADVNDVYGNVYLRNGRVTGVLANRDWSPEPDVYKSALSLFRLVDSASHGQSMRATITSKTREMQNGSSKSVLITLDNGRSIIVEISNIDPGQRMIMQQVVTSECLGPC